MQTNTHTFGVLITLLGGICWGFSGVCGQYLFEQGVSAKWLVPYRLLLAGVMLLAFYATKNFKSFTAPLREKSLLPTLITYGIFGLMMTHYSYFYSIELSNATISTAIQYSAPALILAWICFSERRAPQNMEILALFFALGGVFLLATHGDFSSLAISPRALFWALLSAVGVCVYSLIPKKLNAKFPLALNLGWAMVIGGCVLAGLTRVWTLDGVQNLSQFLAFASVIMIGTICAFSFYMMGVESIGASKASLIACIEPVSSAFFAYFWLDTRFEMFDFIGFAMIMVCVFLLSRKRRGIR
ncbi:DMT family transporter [Campylobacter suis]|nr:EamA family transporter [Campylobacter suis]